MKSQSCCYLRCHEQGYSKPKQQNNEIASDKFLHPTKRYLLWRGLWVSWKGKTSSFSRKQFLPQASTALLHSTWPAAGLPAGSALLAPLPSKPFASHMCIQQVGEKECSQSKSIENTSVERKRDVGGLFIFVMTFSFLLWKWQQCSQIAYQQFPARWLLNVLLFLKVE